MIIKHSEFLLRPINEKDLQGYWECMQDEETKKGFMSVPKNIEEAKEEIKNYIKKLNQNLTEVLTIEINNQYAGNVRLDWQNWDSKSGEGRIHLWMHPKFRNKGIATKALKELVNHGFKNKHMHTIYAQCKKNNVAVCKVIEKSGFKKVENRNVDGIEKIWWEIKNSHNI